MDLLMNIQPGFPGFHALKVSLAYYNGMKRGSYVMINQLIPKSAKNQKSRKSQISFVKY